MDHGEKRARPAKGVVRTLWLPQRTSTDRPVEADSRVSERAANRCYRTAATEQRTAFLLYVEGAMSVSEIGETTDVNPETAKSRLRYAVARLKQALGSDAPD
jgi:RNA polymerase sigma-70 factor (ECF subfamily)